MRGALVLGIAAACASAPAHKPTVDNTAPPASGPRLIAIAGEDASIDEGGLAIVKLAGDQIVPVADGIAGGQFGWLDEHTLVVVEDHALPDGHGTYTGHEIVWARYVDGKPLDHGTVSDRDWPNQDFVEVLATRRDELWLSKCVLNGNECDETHRIYRRLLPSASGDQDHAPDGVDDRRIDERTDEDAWPLPATAAPPPGVTIALGKVDVEVTDPYSQGAPATTQQVTGVICDGRGAHSTYPRSEWSSPGFDEPTRTLRWVSTDPPIYEVAEDQVNPAGYHHVHRVYARACDPPFDGYAWLGGDQWASFALASHDPPNGFGPGEPPRVDGDWTFHAGDRAIGTVHGLDRLRANLSR